MSLGREDGYLERLTVVRGTTTATTAISPRGWAPNPDPLKPPKTWHELIAALCGPAPKAPKVGQLLPLK